MYWFFRSRHRRNRWHRKGLCWAGKKKNAGKLRVKLLNEIWFPIHFQLAKNGLNVVLVSRSKSKLKTVATEISSKYNVETRVIDVDFTSGPQIFDVIKEKIAGLNVGILVNNVGMSYNCPEYFHSIPNQDAFLADLVNCNIVSVTNLCKIVLPRMLEQKKGIIINISSMSATIPNPMLTVYSASKVCRFAFHRHVCLCVLLIHYCLFYLGICRQIF